jgi:hypothetical protein
MFKIVFGALVLFGLHTILNRIGSPDAALWITGGVGSFALICYGLARA